MFLAIRRVARIRLLRRKNMYIDFKKGAWDEKDITHAYTYRFPFVNRFIQRDDCIENGKNPDMQDGFGYDYLSLVSRDKYPLGTTISTRCSFEGVAAPLFIFSDSLDLCEDGAYRYANYFEVVLYKDGVNVWRLWRDEAGEVKWHKRLGVSYPVSEKEIHKISVTLKQDYIVIDLDGMLFTLRAEDLFDSFHLGITGCEGLCRFYDMSIE